MSDKSCSEEYFGCECLYLGHVVHMTYFPPGEDCDESENVLYLSVKSENYLDMILPPFSVNPMHWPFNFSSYLRYHILRRVPIAFRYIFNPSHYRKYGIFDCASFQNKDLPRLIDFLSQLTEKKNEKVSPSSHIGKWNMTADNDRWRMLLHTDKVFRDDLDDPFELGWQLHFLPRKIFGRIRYAFKYIFGIHNESQCFELNQEDAIKLQTAAIRIRNLYKEHEGRSIFDCPEKNQGVKVSSTVMVVKEGKILLGLRGDACETLKNEWAFPGGKMDYLENPAQSALREMTEETGMLFDEKKLEFLSWCNEPFPNEKKHYISLVFLVKNPIGDPKVIEPDKCKEWKWFDPEDIPENTFWACREKIEKHMDKIKNG